MKKLFLAILFFAGLVNAAEESIEAFNVVSDCKGVKSLILFSSWDNDSQKGRNNGVRLSSKTIEVYFDDAYAKPQSVSKGMTVEAQRDARRFRRPYLSSPITEKNFPFRIFVAPESGSHMPHSFVISAKPNIPNTIFMSVEEANSSKTTLRFTCDENHPNEISDWNITVESAKRETHKAARRPNTLEEAQVLKRELTPEEQQRLQEEAKARGEVFVKVPKEPGIAPMVASYLEGELSAEEQQHAQREAEGEFR